MKIRMCKNVSEEEMVVIRKKGQRIKCEHEGLMVMGYIYNDHIYIDDVDFEEVKEADKPEEDSKSKSHKFVHTNDLNNDREIDGTIAHSILSSKLKLRDIGFDLDLISQVNRHISGLSATLWALCAMMIQESEGVEGAKESAKRLDKQVQHQLNDIDRLYKSIIESAKDKELH